MAADEVALRGLNGGVLDRQASVAIEPSGRASRGRLPRMFEAGQSASPTITSGGCSRPSLCENSATEEFWGRLTLGEVEKIAPSAIWRLDISSHSTRSAFSHSLGRE